MLYATNFNYLVGKMRCLLINIYKGKTKTKNRKKDERSSFSIILLVQLTSVQQTIIINVVEKLNTN